MRTTPAELQPAFELILEWCGPNFDSEHRFIRLEAERAQREMDRFREHPLAGQLVAILFGQSHETWKQYAHRLTKYKHVLERHEERLDDGLIPFKALVVNNSGRDLKRVTVTMEVEGGKFDYATHTPMRPTTPEGDRQRDRFAAVMSVPLFGRFARTNIQLEPKTISADFSRLADGQDAFLVNQVVHIHGDDRTRLHYEIMADGMKEAHEGTIRLD